MSYTPAIGTALDHGCRPPRRSYQTILQGVLYNDTSDTPTTSNRSITVVARDSANLGERDTDGDADRSAAVNDAPDGRDQNAARGGAWT